MTNAIRMKGVLIALVALSLSAGAAFASTNGLSVAAGASGKTVPVAAKPETTGTDEDASGTTDQQETEAPEDTPDTTTTTTTPTVNSPTDTNTNCATSPVGLTADQLAAMTHGQIVCWAAHQPTPDGYANHGEWVKSWATGSALTQAGTGAASVLAHKGQGKTHKP